MNQTEKSTPFSISGVLDQISFEEKIHLLASRLGTFFHFGARIGAWCYLPLDKFPRKALQVVGNSKKILVTITVIFASLFKNSIPKVSSLKIIVRQN